MALPLPGNRLTGLFWWAWGCEMIFEREISIEGMKRLSAQDLFHVEEPLAVPSATTRFGPGLEDPVQ